MKLVIAVVHTEDADPCVGSLTDAGFPCTRFASSGGFLDRQNATLMSCVDDTRVDEVLAVLRSRVTHHHEELASSIPLAAAAGLALPAPVDVEVGGATVFVVDVARFERL